MKQLVTTLLILTLFQFSYAQRLLTSWSQQNIENYTKEMYDEAQKLSPNELIKKNITDKYWSEVFLTMNASVNNFSKDQEYLKLLAQQITNKNETKLKGTSRLIIWDRISNGDILFEGKGLVFENDLFTVAGRANQLLQILTKKNFGYVKMNSSQSELENLKSKWIEYLAGKNVLEFENPKVDKGKITEISNLEAVKALIISLQENALKNNLTANCLKKIYSLDKMPTDKKSPANYCNPDTYTYAYLTMLFDDEKLDENKNAKWWLNFWNENQSKLVWNNEKGIFSVKK